MNWPVAFLHVVGGEEVGNAGKSVEEVVFEAEHGGGSNNGRLGEDRARDFLSPSLSI